MLTRFGSVMPQCCRTNQVIIGSLSAHVFSALALIECQAEFQKSSSAC